MKPLELFLAFIFCAGPVLTQTAQSDDYRLALPDHKGQLKWSINGFEIIESSAKPNGREIGLRGRDASGRLTFLGFLFLAPENAPMTSGTCRDGVIDQEKKTNATLKILKISDIPQSAGSPVTLVAYTTANRDGSLAYRVRGFVATGDVCGDLEFYSHDQISDEDADLKKAFLSFQLDPAYAPRFGDLALYAQLLIQQHEYRAAAPIFERALTAVPSDGAPFPSAELARRVMRDQTGMSYGISGDLAKARRIFEEGTAKDPDYPMNYYNLACADAGENKLSEAKIHLQQAFDRKAHMNPGETLPVPTEDDSFLPYKSNQEFWSFLERLEADR
jgi:tetratricopeptide (TPR) repeat protein